MASNSVEHKMRSPNTAAFPLMNKLFDVSRERLVSVNANKKRRRYRLLYLTKPQVRPERCFIKWPGQEIEQVIEHAALEIILDDVAITAALQESGIAAHHIPSALNAAGKIQHDVADLIDRFVQRVELRQDGIRLTLSLHRW